MSTLEPQTTAKVRLTTTKGAIDIELWAKETPVTSRHFLTAVLNSKFEGWEFTRLVRDFLVQVDGQLEQEPFEDEFNTRIRYIKRGMLGSVNLGSRNSNTGKFFITLKETPELQGRNTAFGKVVGEGIYTVLKIAEGEVGEDGETPVYPVKITKCEVLIPYFDDLVKVETAPVVEEVKPKKKGKSKKKLKVKLDFGEEGEGDADVEIKMKSAHDVLDDKRLATEDVMSVVKEAEEEDAVPTKTITPEPEPTVPDTPIPSTLPASIEPSPEKDEVITKDTEKVKTKKQSKLSKEERERETLKLLQDFTRKIDTKKKSTTTTTEKNTDEQLDDDFDNLDDSDSDSDLYSHALKFDDNDDNKAIANEDLLITIDESKQKELRNKRNNDFYRSLDSSSILTKKQKK